MRRAARAVRCRNPAPVPAVRRAWARPGPERDPAVQADKGALAAWLVAQDPDGVGATPAPRWSTRHVRRRRSWSRWPTTWPPASGTAMRPGSGTSACCAWATRWTRAVGDRLESREHARHSAWARRERTPSPRGKAYADALDVLDHVAVHTAGVTRAVRETADRRRAGTPAAGSPVPTRLSAQYSACHPAVRSDPVPPSGGDERAAEQLREAVGGTPPPARQVPPTAATGRARRPGRPGDLRNPAGPGTSPDRSTRPGLTPPTAAGGRSLLRCHAWWEGAHGIPATHGMAERVGRRGPAAMSGTLTASPVWWQSMQGPWPFCT